MKSKRIENSIRSLSNLYTVVIGVALSLAVTGVVDSAKGLEAATVTSVCLFIAFIATLFPFVHGAIRHLDDVYLENPNKHIKDGALVIDFVLLFLHALAFLVLALLIKKPNHFAWGLEVILTIDVLWGAFTYFAASTKRTDSAEFKWFVINLITVGIGAIYLINNDIYLEDFVEPVKLAVPILFISIIRSLVDYVWCRSFYFPK